MAGGGGTENTDVNIQVDHQGRWPAFKSQVAKRLVGKVHLNQQLSTRQPFRTLETTAGSSAENLGTQGTVRPEKHMLAGGSTNRREATHAIGRDKSEDVHPGQPDLSSKFEGDSAREQQQAGRLEEENRKLCEKLESLQTRIRKQDAMLRQHSGPGRIAGYEDLIEDTARELDQMTGRAGAQALRLGELQAATAEAAADLASKQDSLAKVKDLKVSLETLASQKRQLQGEVAALQSSRDALTDWHAANPARSEVEDPAIAKQQEQLSAKLSALQQRVAVGERQCQAQAQRSSVLVTQHEALQLELVKLGEQKDGLGDELTQLAKRRAVAEVDLDALAVKKQEILAELEAVENLRQEAAAAVRHGAAGLEALQARCEEREERLKGFSVELAAAERRRAAAAEDIEHLELRKAGIAAQLDDSEMRKATTAAEIERLQEREAALTAELANLERCASEAAGTSDGLAGRVAALEARETALRSSISKLQAAERDSQAAVSDSEQRLAETEAQLAQQQARLSDLNDMVVEVGRRKLAAEAGVSAAQDELYQLQQHWQDVQRGVVEAESERLSAMQNAAESRAEIAELKCSLETSRSEVRRLTEHCSRLQQSVDDSAAAASKAPAASKGAAASEASAIYGGVSNVKHVLSHTKGGVVTGKLVAHAVSSQVESDRDSAATESLLLELESLRAELRGGGSESDSELESQPPASRAAPPGGSFIADSRRQLQAPQLGGDAADSRGHLGNRITGGGTASHSVMSHLAALDTDAPSSLQIAALAYEEVCAQLIEEREGREQLAQALASETERAEVSVAVAADTAERLAVAVSGWEVTKADLGQARAAHESASERLASLLETLQELRKQHRASELHVQHLLGKTGRLETDLAGRVKEVEEIRAVMQQKQAAATDLEAATKSATALLEQRAAAAEARLLETQARLSETEACLESQISLADDMQNQLIQVQEGAAVDKEEVATVRGQLAVARQQLEAQRRAAEQGQRLLEQTRTQVDAVVAEVAARREESEQSRLSAEDSLVEAERVNGELLSQLRECQAARADISSQLDESHSARNNLLCRLRDAEASIDELEAALEEKLEACARADAELSRLRRGHATDARSRGADDDFPPNSTSNRGHARSPSESEFSSPAAARNDLQASPALQKPVSRAGELEVDLASLRREVIHQQQQLATTKAKVHQARRELGQVTAAKAQLAMIQQELAVMQGELPGLKPADLLSPLPVADSAHQLSHRSTALGGLIEALQEAAAESVATPQVLRAEPTQPPEGLHAGETEATRVHSKLEVTRGTQTCSSSSSESRAAAARKLTYSRQPQ